MKSLTKDNFLPFSWQGLTQNTNTDFLEDIAFRSNNTWWDKPNIEQFWSKLLSHLMEFCARKLFRISPRASEWPLYYVWTCPLTWAVTIWAMSNDFQYEAWGWMNTALKQQWVKNMLNLVLFFLKLSDLYLTEKTSRESGIDMKKLLLQTICFIF